MKLATVGLLMATVVGCSGSNARLPQTAYQARDNVNWAGARVHAKVRPAARPVTASIDKGVARAVASVGLHVGATKN
jgi:hypothetical protein